MWNAMLGMIVQNVIDELLKVENIQVYGDKLLDFVEDAVADSKTKIDDITVLPIIKALRLGLNIPDND